MSARWATLPPGYQLDGNRGRVVRKTAPHQAHVPPSAEPGTLRRKPQRKAELSDSNSLGQPIVSEYEHQVALIEWARKQADVFPGLEWLVASANGGKRSRGVAGQLKASGVLAGFPDLQLALPRGGYHGLFIELKTPTGRPSAAQLEWLAHLNTQGYLALIAYGWRQAKDQLLAYWRANPCLSTNRAAS